MVFLEVAKFSSRRLRRLAAAAQRGMKGKKKEGGMVCRRVAYKWMSAAACRGGPMEYGAAGWAMSPMCGTFVQVTQSGRQFPFCFSGGLL